MIIKSVIAGLTLGGAAFGGVYYGLPQTTPEGAVKPADMARLEPATPQTYDRRNDGVKVAEAHPHPEKMKSKQVEADENDEMPVKSKAKDKPETKWIDNYLKKPKEDKAKTVEIDETDIDEVGPDDVDMKKIIDKVKTEINDGTDKTSDPKVVIKADKDEDTGTFRVISKPAKIKIEPVKVTAKPASSDTLKIVLREAAAIKSDSLKDQAHMDIIDYALRMNDYEAAKDVIAMINQPELRETARSRVAVSYAANGQADAAFDMIDSVEMADFADVMRLQVIEALTQPIRRPDMTK